MSSAPFKRHLIRPTDETRATDCGATSDLKHPTPQSSDLLLESAYASAARAPNLEHMDVKEPRQHLQPSSLCDASASAKLIEAAACLSAACDRTSGGRCDRHGEGEIRRDAHRLGQGDSMGCVIVSTSHTRASNRL